MKSDNKIENKQKITNKKTKIKKIKNNFLLHPKKIPKISEKNNLKITNQNNHKEKEIKIKITNNKIKNLTLSHNRNINDYQQFCTELTSTHIGNLSWATKLRETLKIFNQSQNHKKIMRENGKHIPNEKPKGLSLTENFKEPQFYMEDLEKYKLKIKEEKRPLSSILNPNFNNIRHLFINKNGGCSKEFASSLRNYKSPKNEQKIKWKNYYSAYKENKNVVKFLLPRTPGGKENLRKMEKKIYKPYNVLYKDIVFGNDSIKQKVMTPEKNYIYSGIGEHLNMVNYNTRYRVKNLSYAENILKSGTNSQCLFELGLRNYKSFDAKKKN